MALTIGIDIGGTKVAGGLVDDAGAVVARALRATPSLDPQATEQVVAEVVAELASGRVVEAVGIGAAGFIDEGRSVVRFSANLAWRHEPLRERVERRTGLPVVVENDGNAAAWAEYRYGAGLEADPLLVVCVGTGIGGGIVIGGRLLRGAFGTASEFGHFRTVPDGALCGCGQRGCWEQYASGNALVREARELAAQDRMAARRMLSLGDGTPEGISGRHVTEAAEAGDPVALQAFDSVGGWLGQGIADLVEVLDPERVVIGGGVSESGGLLLAPARRAYEAALCGRANRPHAELVLAALGNEAGVVGAADLARRR